MKVTLIQLIRAESCDPAEEPKVCGNAEITETVWWNAYRELANGGLLVKQKVFDGDGEPISVNMQEAFDDVRKTDYMVNVLGDSAQRWTVEVLSREYI